MSIREIDLTRFIEFAREQIQSGRADVSLTCLAEQWERRQRASGTATNAVHPDRQVARARAYVDELASQQGVTPIRSVSDLRFDFLNSETELAGRNLPEADARAFDRSAGTLEYLRHR